MASEWGQKVKNFYTNTSKQITDIHEEARRIAYESKPKDTPTAGAEKSQATAST
jgi:hypothetical protein